MGRGCYVCQLDGRLSERGRALATELGRRRRNDGVVAVFCSDLGRAVETVEVAFDGSGIPVHPDARLRECDYGAWNGMAVARLERERKQRISQPFPGGESYLQVVARVGDFLEDLARDWDGARVVVVGHSATHWALDHLLAGAALSDLVVAPFDWQEGWAPARFRHRRMSRTLLASVRRRRRRRGYLGRPAAVPPRSNARRGCCRSPERFSW